MTQWKTSQCAHAYKPVEWDLTSSPTTVYQHRNIHEVVIPPSEEHETEITVWEYEERAFTREEYNMMIAVSENVGNEVTFRHDNVIREEAIDEFTVSLIEGGLI